MDEQQTSSFNEEIEEKNRRIKERKKEHFWQGFRELRYKYSGIISMLLVTLATGVLAYFDYLSIEELFSRSDIKSANEFAILFAFCLEGIPFFSASFVAKLFVQRKVKENDALYAGIGVFLGAIGLIMAWGIAVYTRYIVIKSSGGVSAYLDPEDPDLRYIGYTADIFLQFSPIITSILAFLASWSITSKDIEKKLKKEVDFYFKKFLHKEAVYLEEAEKLSNMRVSVWNSVTQHEVERVDIPHDDNVFREEVVKRIRKQLISNSIAVYPSEVERFQNKIEEELREYQSKLALHCTNPEIILEIDIKKLIQQYDEECLQKGQLHSCWDYSKAGRDLEEQLKRLVDNNVSLAHSSFGLGGR